MRASGTPKRGQGNDGPAGRAASSGAVVAAGCSVGGCTRTPGQGGGRRGVVLGVGGGGGWLGGGLNRTAGSGGGRRGDGGRVGVRLSKATRRRPGRRCRP